MNPGAPTLVCQQKSDITAGTVIISRKGRIRAPRWATAHSALIPETGRRSPYPAIRQCAPEPGRSRAFRLSRGSGHAGGAVPWDPVRSPASA